MYTVSKQKFCLNLPYVGHETDKIRRELLSLLSSYFPQVQPIFYFRCNFTLGSFFRLRDSPDPIWCVAQLCDRCQLSYIGSALLFRCPGELCNIRESLSVLSYLSQNPQNHQLGIIAMQPIMHGLDSK